jgi:hypothetical protein
MIIKNQVREPTYCDAKDDLHKTFSNLSYFKRRYKFIILMEKK